MQIMRTTMYQDKSIPLLIIGSIVTAMGSMLTNIYAGMGPFLGWISRADITFSITCLAGITTIVAGLIKARRDWVEGKMRIPFVKSRSRKKRA